MRGAPGLASDPVTEALTSHGNNRLGGDDFYLRLR